MKAKPLPEIPEQIAQQLSEFFDSYYLVGYTMDKKTRCVLRHITSPLAHDALAKLMENQRIGEMEPSQPVVLDHMTP